MEAVMAGHTSRTCDGTGYNRRQPVRCGAHVHAIDPLVVRRIARVSFVGLLAVAAIVVTVTRACQPEQPAPAAWSSVTVAEGSSLWDLATANPVYGLQHPRNGSPHPGCQWPVYFHRYARPGTPRTSHGRTRSLNGRTVSGRSLRITFRRSGEPRPFVG